MLEGNITKKLHKKLKLTILRFSFNNLSDMKTTTKGNVYATRKFNYLCYASVFVFYISYRYWLISVNFTNLIRRTNPNKRNVLICQLFPALLIEKSGKLKTLFNLNYVTRQPNCCESPLRHCYRWKNNSFSIFDG